MNKNLCNYFKTALHTVQISCQFYFENNLHCKTLHITFSFTFICLGYILVWWGRGVGMLNFSKPLGKL